MSLIVCMTPDRKYLFYAIINHCVKQDFFLSEIGFVFFIQSGIMRGRQTYIQFYFDEVVFITFGSVDFLGNAVECKYKELSVDVLSRI